MPDKAETPLIPDLDPSKGRRVLAALLIALAGGAAFAYADLPLPWMLGAMAATMGASLAGAAITVPQSMRKPMIAIVGVTLGSAFTPDRLEGIAAWLPSIAILPVYVLIIGVFILVYLRRVSRFDGKTAFFAATPGGLSEMVILADQLGADMRNVALFHAARLVLIVFSIPVIAKISTSLEPVLPIDAEMGEIVASDLLVLGGLLLAGWLGALPLRLPSPSFMGPLLLSSAVHLAGVTEAVPPFILVAAAQLVIGASVGCRFSGVPLRLIARTLAIGAGGAFFMIAVTLVFALGLHWATENPLALLLLALIPGGFPEMSLLALGMGFDPAFVVTHHGIRVLLVVTCALPIYSWLARSGWFERYWPRRRTRSAPATDLDGQPNAGIGGRSARK